jgi:hypothetical protein
MRRLLLIGAVLGAWVANIAATGQSEQNAIAIATVIGLLLPFVLKLVPQAGHAMVAITVVAAFVAAVAAELLSGELSLSNLGALDTQTLLGLFMSVYGLSQLVYSTLTQKPATTVAVA